MKTLVLAIGNTLLTDEGVGIHALQALQEQHPEPAGVTYMDGGTLSFTLAGAVEDADNLIVLDAQRDLFRDGRDYLRVSYDLVNAIVVLERAAGQLDEQDIIQINSWLK